MSKYTIEYTVEAESAAQALSMAHENVYFAEFEPEEVRVRPVLEEVSDPYQTFGGLPKVESGSAVNTRFTDARIYNQPYAGSVEEKHQRRIDSFNEPG